MSIKMLAWTLIEIITLFLFCGGLMLLLKWRLVKSRAQTRFQPDPELNLASDTSNTSHLSSFDDPSLILKRMLTKQMRLAAKELQAAKGSRNQKKVITIKLWGSLLKAENQILEKPDKKEIDEILKKDLLQILNGIFNSKKDNASLKALEVKLEKFIKAAQQSNEILRLKSELEHAQNVIRQELLEQISKLDHALGQLEIKRHEKDHLELTLTNASENYNQLVRTLDQLDQENEFSTLATPNTPPSMAGLKEDLKAHSANKKIKSLKQIASRQQIVIDLLREKLIATDQTQSINVDESQEIAIQRIEQMIKESDSLIIQLDNELGETNLTIQSLKSEIKFKSEHVFSMEKKLLEAEKSILSSFKESNQAQQLKVDDMNQQLSSLPQTSPLHQLIQEQQEEANNLERLLKESETCATLLESELELARKANQDMIHTIETVDPGFQRDTENRPLNNNIFQQLEFEHHNLLAEHSQVKQQLLANVEADNETDLKHEINRKKLEIDRLKVAISELDKKQAHKQMETEESTPDQDWDITKP